jgi:secreted trypsin-like serine protease
MNTKLQGILSFKALLAITLLTSACAKPPVSSLEATDSDASIVNGETVQAAEDITKSTVNIYMTFGPRNSPQFTNFCSGTLIAPDLVVTAAHCIVDLAQDLKWNKATYLKNVKVGFGNEIVKSLRDSRVRFVGLKDLKVHEGYTPESLQNAEKEPMKDIALLRLSQRAPAGFVPAQLPLATTALKAGDRVTLAGFGLINGIFGVQATSLNKVDVTIHNPKMTEAQFSYLTEKGQTACSGDSGGPAYLRDSQGKLVVVGVTSWGDNQCVEKGVYTSLIHFRPWVVARLGKF